MYINKAYVFGNLTRDPELKATTGGQKVTTFSVATNRQYKKGDGSKAEEVEFHNIVVWGKTGEACAQYLRKGSSVFVEGRIRTRSYESDKGKQYRTEIIAENVQFGPQGARKGDEGVDQRPPAERAAEARTAPSTGIEYPEDMNPDDIPF